jgi:hypothetical protein
LSAGKLTFKDIMNIIKSSNLSDMEDALNQVFNVYNNFDDDLSVIWKKG